MFVAILFFVTLFITLLYMDTRKPRGFPPGPAWLPIVGSSIAVHKERQKYKYLYQATGELARQYCAADEILGLKVGKDRCVVVCGYEATREMLLNEDLDGRPRGPFYETRTWGIRRGLIFTDEEFWQGQRRFVVRHLKEFGFGRRPMVDLVQEEAERLLVDMTKEVGTGEKIIEMQDAFSVYVLNTLWSMLAGVRYTSEDKELVTLQGLLADLFTKIDMVGCLFSQFPILRYVAPELSGYNQFITIHRKLWAFLNDELIKHKTSFRPEDEPRDFMDVYLKMLSSRSTTSSFSETQLLAICLDMFMAGSETTTKALGYIMLYLVRNEDVQRKAQSEIDAVIGRDRLPTLDDRSNMPYCEAIVMEAVRLFMGRTFGIPHRALKDTTLCGYNIPKDTMVINNFYGMMMCTKTWPDVNAFRPERFLKDGKVLVHEKYLPFGLGKRRCMGDMLGRSNMFLFTTTLLQHFSFSPVVGEPLPSLDALDGATPSVQPYRALVSHRSFVV